MNIAIRSWKTWRISDSDPVQVHVAIEYSKRKLGMHGANAGSVLSARYKRLQTYASDVNHFITSALQYVPTRMTNSRREFIEMANEIMCSSSHDQFWNGVTRFMKRQIPRASWMITIDVHCPKVTSSVSITNNESSTCYAMINRLIKTRKSSFKHHQNCAWLCSRLREAWLCTKWCQNLNVAFDTYNCHQSY